MTKASLAQFALVQQNHCFWKDQITWYWRKWAGISMLALYLPVWETWGFKSIGNMYLYRYASVLCPSLEFILVEANGICFIWLYFPRKLLPKHNIWQLLLKTRGLISLDFSGFWLKGQAESMQAPSCWARGGNVALWCELRYLIALAEIMQICTMDAIPVSTQILSLQPGKSSQTDMLFSPELRTHPALLTLLISRSFTHFSSSLCNRFCFRTGLQILR